MCMAARHRKGLTYKSSLLEISQGTKDDEKKYRTGIERDHRLHADHEIVTDR